MQKIKKALKSLVKLSSKKPAQPEVRRATNVAPRVAAKAAKKKVDVKKKPAPAKKVPVKKAAPAPKKAAPVKPAPAKPPLKTAAVKADPKAKKAAPAAPVKPVPVAKEIKKKPETVPTKPEAKVKKPVKAARGEEDEIPEIDDIDDVVIVEETDGPMPVEVYAEPESDEVVLTDADGRRYCRVKECDQISAVDGYCRYHYLLLWKKIQVRKKILSEGKLERYIEDLTARYPDKYLEMLRKDLRNEKDFMAAIHELEIDESASENEFEDETQSFAEEIRGMSGDTPARDDDEF